MDAKLKNTIAVGTLSWFATGIGVLSAYLLTLDSFDEWSWFTVIRGLIAQISVGLGALAVLLSKRAGELPKQERFEAQVSGDPVTKQIFGGRVFQADNFTRAELECKGKHCDCTFPGMSYGVISIAEYLRSKYGRLKCTSGHRCKIHNESVGGEDDSYHVLGRGMDLRSLEGVSPKVMYDDLVQRFPNQYGFGLYETFIHVDDRSKEFARKSAPDKPWKAFEHAEVDIHLS